jgi:hypothetical protein
MMPKITLTGIMFCKNSFRHIAMVQQAAAQKFGAICATSNDA